MIHLLDKNICIYLMKSRPASVAARFAALRAGDVGISALDLGPDRFDAPIAAHALSRRLVLVTNNVKDYAGPEGLRAENWVEGC